MSGMHRCMHAKTQSVFQAQPNSSLSPEPRFDANLNWINTAVRSDWLFFSGLYKSAASRMGVKMGICLFVSCFISQYCQFTLKDVGCEGNLCAYAAVCSQTRCSLWFTANSKLLAYFSGTTQSDAPKTHSGALCEGFLAWWVLNYALVFSRRSLAPPFEASLFRELSALPHVDMEMLQKVTEQASVKMMMMMMSDTACEGGWRFRRSRKNRQLLCLCPVTPICSV